MKPLIILIKPKGISSLPGRGTFVKDRSPSLGLGNGFKPKGVAENPTGIQAGIVWDFHVVIDPIETNCLALYGIGICWTTGQNAITVIPGLIGGIAFKGIPGK